MKFEIYRRKPKGQFGLRLKSGNHKIVVVTEGYKRRAGALHAINCLIRWADGERKIVDETMPGKGKARAR